MPKSSKRSRGAKPLTLHDWPFGARNRRLLLERVLSAQQPDDGWTMTALAEATEDSSPNGSLDDHVAGLMQWGIIERGDDGRFRRIDPAPELAAKFQDLLQLVKTRPNEALQPIPRRAYRRRR